MIDISFNFKRNGEEVLQNIPRIFNFVTFLNFKEEI